MDHSDALTAFILVTRHKTQNQIADELGCSPQFVSAVFSGRKKMNAAMLDFIGMEKVTEYRVKQHK